MVLHAARAAGPSGHAGQRIGPYLIKTGNDAPSTAYIVANPSIVAALPFDGFSWDPGNINQLIFSTTAVSLAACQADMAGMAAAKPSFGQNNRYFPRILTITNSPPDWWNDTQWATVTQNFANLAQAANAAGCHGILFDPEYYGTGPSPWDWGSTGYQTGAQPSAPGVFGDSGSVDPNSIPGFGIDPTHNLQDSRTKVQARGKQVMDAILAQWPTCRFLMYYGPFMSSYLTGTALNPPTINPVSWANELMGTFGAGIAESCITNGNRGAYIDGGEIYSPRTIAEFYTINDWRTRGLPASPTTVMSPTLKATWQALNGIGIFDKDYSPPFPTQTPAAVQSEITLGMRTNSYVWLYTETHDWWGTGFPATPVPQTWKDAVAAGRAAGRL